MDTKSDLPPKKYLREDPDIDPYRNDRDANKGKYEVQIRLNRGPQRVLQEVPNASQWALKVSGVPQTTPDQESGSRGSRRESEH